MDKAKNSKDNPKPSNYDRLTPEEKQAINFSVDAALAIEKACGTAFDFNAEIQYRKKNREDVASNAAPVELRGMVANYKKPEVRKSVEDRTKNCPLPNYGSRTFDTLPADGKAAVTWYAEKLIQNGINCRVMPDDIQTRRKANLREALANLDVVSIAGMYKNDSTHHAIDSQMSAGQCMRLPMPNDLASKKSR